MTTALVLGAGDTLWDDIASLEMPFDGVVACNDAGVVWPEKLDAWVSLHPRYFQTKRWRQDRVINGYPEALRHFGHLEAEKIRRGEGPTCDVEFVDYLFPGQEKSGSSGLFAAKVALIDLGFDNVVFCGVPMTKTPHFWDNTKVDWRAAEGFARQWLTVPIEYRSRMKSMSGWTKEILGEP